MGAKDIEQHKFQKGESGNPTGRPKGSKNRSTIARQWLETTQKAKNPITGVEEILTQEDLGTLAMVKKMREGDVSAYKELMNSAYGAPLQQIEQTILEQPLFPDVSENDSNE